MEREAQQKPRFTKNQAKIKAGHFCAYQERCQQEVRDKLYTWGLHQAEVEELIAELIIDDFLNEERFAMAYVSGKFNIKGWGRLKIKQGLKQKMIPSKMIGAALKTVDAARYYERLLVLLEKKAILLKEVDSYKRKNKLAQYAIGKGYESELIFDVLNNNNL